MVNTHLNILFKTVIYFSFVTLSFSQRLDPQDKAYEELRSMVETASRSQQRIWVEDFTGLN